MFPSAPENHPHQCPQITLLSLTLAWIAYCVQHLACICISTCPILLSATQLLCQNSNPSTSGFVTSFLHLIFNFSPKVAKPHVELQSTAWTCFQPFTFNICPCIQPWPASLDFPEATGFPVSGLWSSVEHRNHCELFLSPHVHKVKLHVK